MLTGLIPTPETVDLAALKARRSWRAKFGDAFRGLKLGIRGHSSFFVHFFFAALVVAAAVVFHCTPPEWCLLLGCIGLVLTAEMFNSAIETLFRGLDDESVSGIAQVEQSHLGVQPAVIEMSPLIRPASAR